MAVDVPRRLCGVRQKGGVYAECGLSQYGLPLEHFVYDPVRPVDPAALGVTPVGVKLIEIDGTWHVIDWVGSEFYPNAADVLEEIRRMGLSRRLPVTLDFSKLTADSRIILMHARGYPDDWPSFDGERERVARPFHEARTKLDFRCPKQAVVEHPNVSSGIAADAYVTAAAHSGIPGEPVHAREACCSSVWWDAVSGAEGGRRSLPCGSYGALDYSFNARSWQPALIARFPIHNLAIIRDGGSARETKATGATKAAAIPTDLKEA